MLFVLFILVICLFNLKLLASIFMMQISECLGVLFYGCVSAENVAGEAVQG